MGLSEDDKDAADNSSNGSETKKKTVVVCCKHGKPCEFANDHQHHRNKATDDDVKSEREKRAYENMPGPNLAELEATRSSASSPDEKSSNSDGNEKAWSKKRERDSNEYVNLMDLDSLCQEGDVPMESSDDSIDWDEHEDISTVRSDIESMRLQHVYDMPTAEDKDNNMDPTMTTSKTKSGRDQSDDQKEEGTRATKSPSQMGLTERLKSRGMLPAMKDNSKGDRSNSSAADGDGLMKNPSQMDPADRLYDRKVKTARQGSDPDVSCCSRSVTTVDSTSQASLDKINPKEQLLEFYIGQCTPTRAEQLFSSKMPPLGFRLYHRVEEGPELQVYLPLFIVHQRMTGHKEFRHIRILRCGKNGDWMRVDIEGEPQFQTLSQLITFYDIYASFDNNLEPFPKKQSASGDDD